MLPPWAGRSMGPFPGRNDVLNMDERVEAFSRHYATRESHWGGHSGGGCQS